MVGQGFIEAVQVGGDGGGKAKQGEVAEEHSVSGSVLAGSFAVIPAKAGIQRLDMVKGTGSRLSPG
jgi:hypothetical protein